MQTLDTFNYIKRKKLRKKKIILPPTPLIEVSWLTERGRNHFSFPTRPFSSPPPPKKTKSDHWIFFIEAYNRRTICRFQISCTYRNQMGWNQNIIKYRVGQDIIWPYHTWESCLRGWDPELYPAISAGVLPGRESNLYASHWSSEPAKKSCDSFVLIIKRQSFGRSMYVGRYII